MIQFTESEVLGLREKARRQPQVIEALKQQVSTVFESPVLVPAEGIANWTLYYYCPDCSVHLSYSRTSANKHKCLSCGQTHTGEPFDSSWWGLLNSQNYNAVGQMALIYLATGLSEYADKAKAILIAYAENYPNYQVHGDIPYNGPGRSGAQTLDEANFQRALAIAYDILSGTMTEAEQMLVRDQLLLPGAEFLTAHRHNQIHNHEVIINSAIAVIGLIFDRDDLIDFAVYQPYGILYQLEHGMQDNGLWFEGGFGYHFYALKSFFTYEKFALHTRHSHINHPNYRQMMEITVSYLQPDYIVPMLGDTNYVHLSDCYDLYEFAYRELGGDKLLFILNILYRERPRANVEAFFYGTEVLPACELPLSPYHVTPGTSGNTIVHGPDGRYLLLKNDAYGGEHDHYDRLGISYLACGKRIAPDLGTTGYGAKMHYDYYKNTGSHNTVVIGEENQSPANAVLTRYEKLDGVVYIEAECDWTAPYQPLDSFTIPQWKEENYRTVRMRRKIAWLEHYFLEVFEVVGVDKELSTDWVMHMGGVRQETAETADMDMVFEKKPLKYLKDTKIAAGDGKIRLSYRDGEVTTDLYTFTEPEAVVYLAMGPDNPSTSDINYVIERNYGTQSRFIHAVESYEGEARIREIEIAADDGTVTFLVKEDGQVRTVRL